MTEEFLVSWKGETLGPFTRDEVQRRLLSGEISPLHAIHRDGELIDAERWLHSLRPSKTPPPPAPAIEPFATPPQNQAPTSAYPISVPVAELPHDFPAPLQAPTPPAPPVVPPPPAISSNFDFAPNSNVPPPPPPPPPPQQTYAISNPKSRVAFILLGLFLGLFGIHNFYAGYTGKALTQLLLNLFLFWTVIVPLGISIWVLVEVITISHDAQGRPFA
jgi:hypothetical protein